MKTFMLRIMVFGGSDRGEFFFLNYKKYEPSSRNTKKVSVEGIHITKTKMLCPKVCNCCCLD